MAHLTDQQIAEEIAAKITDNNNREIDADRLFEVLTDLNESKPNKSVIDNITDNMVLLSGFNIYTGQQNFGAVNLISGESVAWDLNVAQSAILILDQDAELLNPTNTVDGGKYTLRVIQDSAGDRSLYFNSAYRTENNLQSELSAIPNAIDIFIFESDGEELFEVSHTTFIPDTETGVYYLYDGQTPLFDGDDALVDIDDDSVYLYDGGDAIFDGDDWITV